MLLTPMRYKDYTWPHNPETYSVEYRRQVVVHKVPFGQYVLQDVGETCRIFQGEGTFAGPDAYEQFQALSEVFAQEGAGLLVHPIWRTTSAYFISLKLEEKPLPDYVHYSFAFWEDCGAYSTGLVTWLPRRSPNPPVRPQQHRRGLISLKRAIPCGALPNGMG